MKVVFTFVVLFALAALACAAKSPPTYSDEYYVELHVTMPTFPIVNEKMELWVDGKSGNEYVSYDDDLDANLFVTKDGKQSAFQISPRGSSPSDVSYACYTSGINTAPFMFSAFPYELNKFEYVGTSTVNGQEVDEFFLYGAVSGFPNAINNMTFFADASTGAPVKFEYKGFYGANPSEGWANSPNYDWFVVTYNTYTPGSVNTTKFEIPKICQDATVSATVPTARMAASRLHPADVSYDDIFDEYKAAHGRDYDRYSKEHADRAVSFADNLAEVHRLNNKHSGARFALNHFGDRHSHEIKAVKSSAPRVPSLDDDAIVYKAQGKMADLPKSVNWIHKGAVGPLKEQGTQGDCWSFGSVAALEGAYYLKHGSGPSGEFVQFSEQQLIDCSWGEGDNGGNGGTAKGAYKYVEKAGGLATEQAYPFLMADGICHKAPYNLSMSHHEDIFPGSAHDLMDALANHGPLAVAACTDPPVWTWYQSGVADPEGCNPLSLDHEIALVGMQWDGHNEDSIVWLIRNTWSKLWGSGTEGGGYMWLAHKAHCGITASAVLPFVN